MSSAQETGSILKVDFALSSSPLLHKAYLVTVCNQSFIALRQNSNLNNYFDFHFCLSIHGSVRGSGSGSICPKLTSIPAKYH